jgi:hypothetical protein
MHFQVPSDTRIALTGSCRNSGPKLTRISLGNASFGPDISVRKTSLPPCDGHEGGTKLETTNPWVGFGGGPKVGATDELEEELDEEEDDDDECDEEEEELCDEDELDEELDEEDDELWLEEELEEELDEELEDEWLELLDDDDEWLELLDDEDE